TPSYIFILRSYMSGINSEQFPEFIDISNYPRIYRVFAKQLERNEQVLTEIRDALVEHNRLHMSAQKTTKKKPKTKVQ
ncbi:hypothetical protein KA005_63915, partial [bacterium]|nr:hypothetical protein [bacterium]